MRFLTRDPIGMEGGGNLYAYCRNRAVLLHDRPGTMGSFRLSARRMRSVWQELRSLATTGE